MYSIVFANIHHDVTTSELDGIYGLNYRESRISEEQNMVFLQNKKILNCASKTTFFEVIMFYPG